MCARGYRQHFCTDGREENPVASQCVSNVVSLITRLIQVRSFVMMFFALIIVLRDTCFRLLEETIMFQFICIVCVMLLVLCFELFQHVPDY